MIVFAVVLFTQATSGAAFAASPDNYYVVRAHDTLDSIARTHGMSSWSLASMNGVWDEKGLRPGQVLYFQKQGNDGYGDRGGYQWYNGRNWYGGNQGYIDQGCGGRDGCWFPKPPVRDGCGCDDRNRCDSCPRPCNDWSCCGGQCRIYVVRCGDTLSSIAWKLGVDVWSLAHANGIQNPNWIFAGQRLVISGGY